MEYKTKGKCFWHYNYPPRANKEDFTDLELIALEKITELELVQTKAKKLHDKRFELLEKTSKDNLWRLVYETQYQTEIYYIDRWLKYWGRIGGSDKVEVKQNGSFTDEQIENARQYPIQNLYEGKLHGSQNRLMGKCPFHEERTASFVIYPDNSFHCFGCSTHGNNAIDYLVLQDVDFPEAVRRLA